MEELARKHLAAHAKIEKRPSHAKTPEVIMGKPSVATRRHNGGFGVIAVVFFGVLLAMALSLSFAQAGNFGTPAGQDPFNQTANGYIAFNTAESMGPGESFILENAATCDRSTVIADVQQKEEQARIAAEEKARQEEQEAISRVQAAKAKAAAKGGVGVNDVDFTVGKDAFIKEWTARIDKYLSGSPLAGYGSTFAEAAWKYGVDPRWSPAISNTESTKGQNCFMPHNAWGWTGGSWPNWSSAIWTHVSNLSSLYGYAISYENAKTYCPPNYDNWYNDTLREMYKI